MKRIMEMSEILGIVDLPEGTFELIAMAHASYDEDSHRLVVQLASVLRVPDSLDDEKRLQANWLPKNVTICEFISFQDSHEAVTEIVTGWVNKVRHSAPSLQNQPVQRFGHRFPMLNFKGHLSWV